MKFVDPKKKEREELKEQEMQKIKANFKSQREKLLEKIKEKNKKKSEQTTPDEEIVEVIEEETNSQRIEREEKEEKERLSKKAEEKRKQQEDVKSRTSSRDNLKEKIKDLETQISKTKYNKKTQGAIGLMKAQLASLKDKLSGGSGKGGKKDTGYSVKKSGDATVVLLGFPSAGKSTLLNSITNASSEVGAYAFTTLSVIPGLLKYKDAKIQILDVPGIVEGAASGSGRGKEVLQVIRTADLIIILIDALKPSQKKLLEKEVYESHVRINQERPDIKIRKTLKDGIRVGRTVQTEIDDETIKSILNQFKVINAEVLLRDDINTDQFIDIIQGNKEYIPAITVVNKVDILKPAELKKIKKDLNPDLCISAQQKQGLDELKDLIYDSLHFIRVYLKEVNNPADMDEPMIMRKRDTIKELCGKLHKDFIDKFKYVRMWGPSAKFDGQMLQKLDHELKDGDIVEVHLR